MLKLLSLMNLHLYSVENGKLKTSASFPGLSVVYSVDDGTSWYPVIDDMTVPAGNVLLAVRYVLFTSFFQLKLAVD